MRKFVYTFIILGFVIGIGLSYFVQSPLIRSFVPFGEYITSIPSILKEMNLTKENQAIAKTLITTVCFTTLIFAVLGYAIGNLSQKTKEN